VSTRKRLVQFPDQLQGAGISWPWLQSSSGCNTAHLPTWPAPCATPCGTPAVLCHCRHLAQAFSCPSSCRHAVCRHRIACCQLLGRQPPPWCPLPLVLGEGWLPLPPPCHGPVCCCGPQIDTPWPPTPAFPPCPPPREGCGAPWATCSGTSSLRRHCSPGPWDRGAASLPAASMASEPPEGGD